MFLVPLPLIAMHLRKEPPGRRFLPSLTVLSLWLLEWSGMSLSREWWECECLALRLSASAAVSVLPRRVNLPVK